MYEGNEIMQSYVKKLLNRKQSEKFFTKDEVLLLKNMEMFNGDGRIELAHKFQEFINENYKRVTTSEIVAEVYFNEGIENFEEIADKLNLHGKNEKVNGGTQRNGQLCKRHIEMLLKDGKIIT